ncbi:heavy metal translocating P-type ATPase [Sutterella sp.]|uniref:heavy metal translocating P-type ATPase n=1 Tax=Sutterella sp. TaxID=1981025 RepID=UPI0026E04DC4|nr:heavy metal translocating P-type ATPase [Sutterella sp.]MDO5530973.1 heavy metal translocating P-type ATPase [Sutterella sp.]
MKNITLSLPDMCCPAEFGPVERALQKLDASVRIVPDYGVRQVRITLPDGCAVDEAAVLETVRATGTEFRRLDDAPAGDPVRIRVPEMDCPVEQGEIEREFKKAGIEGFSFDLMNRTVVLPSDHATVSRAIEAIRAAGYEPELSGSSAAGGRVKLSVPEMDCPVEAGEIEREFKKAGLEGYEIDVMNRTIGVDVGQAEAAIAAVKAAGYEATLIAPATAGGARTLISVPEMDCPVEAGEIEREFRKAGLTDWETNIMNRTIAVPAGAVAAAQAAIKAAGYSSTMMAGEKREADFEDRTPWRRYILALVVAVGCEFIEIGAENGVIPLEESVANVVTLVLALVAIALVGLTTFRKGIQSAMRGTLNMNTLMAVAVTGGVLIGAWPEAAMVLVLFEISEAIEQLSMTRARRSIRDLMSVAPEKALVEGANGEFTEMKVSEVGPGAMIRVAPGDRVPLDGRIESGNTTLDQSMVTGESMPAEKGPGETVWAGTVNLSSTILVTVTAAAGQSLTARIIEAVENAQATKSPVQRFVDRFAAVYTPIVFVVALAVAILPPLFLGDWLGWLYKALCLLVIACPCALVISTPVTIVSALATATRCGLLIKGGLFLEEARKLKNVGLDKTGTLTKGEPKVEKVTLFFGTPRSRALSVAASLGAMNKHPLSQAIVALARAEQAQISKVTEFTALPGSGVRGRVGRGEAALLNLTAIEEKGFATPEVKAAFEEAAAAGRSSVALTDPFGVIAHFALADEIKADTRSGLRQLAAEGVTPWLLTGDNARAANALAHELGLENVSADLLPEQKLERIRELQAEGLTAMVGDGINDAPALAQADIGIAMGVRGTDSAIEAADIALMDDRVSSVATLVRLSRMTHTVLVQNIAFAIGIKVIFTILALCGMATMWMAVFADTGTCLIVVANGMRMLRAKKRLDAMARAVDEAAEEKPAAAPKAAAAAAA